jgi:hypothetical protein
MPILAGLGSLLLSLFTMLAAVIGRKLAVAGASVVAMMALTLAFVVCIGQMISYIQTLLIFPPFLISIGWFIPSNFTFCISTLLSARTCRAAYDLMIAKVHLINNAS